MYRAWLIMQSKSLIKDTQNLTNIHNIARSRDDFTEGYNNINSTNFVDALRNKYRAGADTSYVGIFIPTKRPGFDAFTESLSALTVPTGVILSNDVISRAGNMDSVKNTLIHVTEIDLTNNRIANWREVINIIEHCPRLTLINLTSNPLGCADHNSNRFHSVTHVILNATRMPWHCLPNVVENFPCLRELHLSNNNYTDVKLDPHAPLSTSVTALYFSSNAIDDFRILCRLGTAFPNLNTLVFTDTVIETFSSAIRDIDRSFRHLVYLNLNRSKISQLETIDELNAFPALTEIRLLGIPLLNMYSQEVVRDEVLVRLPRITHLNGSLVGNKERDQAERNYLRSYRHRDPKPTRFDELEAKHGHLEPLVDVDLTPRHFMTFQFSFNDEITEQTVDVRQTVRQLKTSLRSLCRLDPCEFRLYFRDIELYPQFGDEELKFPDKLLYSLNVHDGDMFIIEPKTSLYAIPFSH